ncbi:MAG: hypothetical protein IKC47_00380 [Clostridia bacterium]|nr:hypothetical protein [Clostridia bacterium]
MIVSKFGGTCCTHLNAAKVKQVLTPNHHVVVVSAIGKTHPTDTKVTDLLIALHNNLPDVSIFDLVAQKYQKLAKICQYTQIDALLSSTITDIVTKNNYHNTISKGEEMSARLFAHYLGYQYVEAEELFAFDGSSVNLKQTFVNAKKAYALYGNFVTGGFYGGSSVGRQTFSRGGSDVSGAILASALSATLYENYTDVNGVCVANPSRVSLPFTARCISYDDMYLMSRLGANVLHPDAVTMARQSNVPINVRSLFEVSDFGTLITSASSPQQVLGITESQLEDGYQTNVIHSLDGFSILARLARVLIEMPNLQVFSVTQKDNLVSICTNMPIIKAIYNCLLTNCAN